MESDRAYGMMGRGGKSWAHSVATMECIRTAARPCRILEFESWERSCILDLHERMATA